MNWFNFILSKMPLSVIREISSAYATANGMHVVNSGKLILVGCSEFISALEDDLRWLDLHYRYGSILVQRETKVILEAFNQSRTFERTVRYPSPVMVLHLDRSERRITRMVSQAAARRLWAKRGVTWLFGYSYALRIAESTLLGSITRELAGLLSLKPEAVLQERIRVFC